ncbi:MAG: holo-ACP synthase [Thiotrichales bacterium]|nr:holo-ACP synthase [Thiotrichales bacterium]
MIVGIGTDIVDIQRIEKAISCFGERFAQKILSDREFGDYQSASSQPAFLAKRFAAKEATVKALGTGFRSGLRPSHISVEHDELGRPCIQLLSIAQTIANDLGVSCVHISVADEQRYAVAFATAIT